MISPKITLIKKSQSKRYKCKNFQMDVKNEADLPMIYYDQDKYIHFETKKFHVWSKILMSKTEAEEHMGFLGKNTEALKDINSCRGDCNKFKNKIKPKWLTYFNQLSKLIGYDFNNFWIDYP